MAIKYKRPGHCRADNILKKDAALPEHYPSRRDKLRVLYPPERDTARRTERKFKRGAVNVCP